LDAIDTVTLQFHALFGAHTQITGVSQTGDRADFVVCSACGCEIAVPNTVEADARARAYCVLCVCLVNASERYRLALFAAVPGAPDKKALVVCDSSSVADLLKAIVPKDLVRSHSLTCSAWPRTYS
jgi:hypothetical protein